MSPRLTRPSSRSAPAGRSTRRRSRLSRRFRKGRRYLLALLALSALGLVGFELVDSGLIPVNQAADAWYDKQQANEVLVELPRDDAPHNYYVEWWYYNGHVQDEAGERFSFHYVVFLINALATHTVAHVSVVDQQALSHAVSQRRTPGNPSSGSIDGFDFKLADWTMRGGDGKDRLRFQAGDQRWDLTLREAAPPVMQGGTGLLSFERTGSSYYYSRPRMEVSGTLTSDQGQRRVSGSAWFDHQWGDFEVFDLGWDWFALSLEDGRDIMLYRLFDPRDGSSVLTSGTLAEDGATVVLGAEDFRIDVLDHWLSPQTGRRYPMGWRIDIPKFELDLSVSPVLPNSEFDGRETTYQVYWEGPVDVAGSKVGVGYVEMSGYGTPEPDP